MEAQRILSAINESYSIKLSGIELLREGGNATYKACSDAGGVFIKVIGPAFFDTFLSSLDIHIYLQSSGFPVPRLLYARDNRPYISAGESLIVLYEFLELSEIDMEKDAEEVGALIGRLHALMSEYNGELIVRDRAYYIDRYVDILRRKNYPKAEEFARLGGELWTRVSGLPRGYSHGDMYSGNIARGQGGGLYVLDFDTSCIGFPMYDIALICNRTDYFRYDDNGLHKTEAIYRRLLPEYLKHKRLSEPETRSIYDMLAMYHFALQATIIEIHGLDCVDNAFFDRQLRWLNRWQAQCRDECFT